MLRLAVCGGRQAELQRYEWLHLKRGKAGRKGRYSMPCCPNNEGRQAGCRCRSKVCNSKPSQAGRQERKVGQGGRKAGGGEGSVR